MKKMYFKFFLDSKFASKRGNRWNTFIILSIFLFCFTCMHLVFWPKPPVVDLSEEDIYKIPSRFLTNVGHDEKSDRTATDEFPYDVPDVTKLNLQFIHAPSQGICKGIDAIILVVSKVQNVKQRATIRNTWASLQTKQIKVVFLLGLPAVGEDEIITKVIQEVHGHNDIVQGSFNDAYWNVTVKTLMGLKWVYEYCNEARFVFFCDDDVYLNLDLVLPYLNTFGSADLLMCAIEINHNIVIERNGVWAVPVSRYNGTVWPRYCSGGCFVMTQNVAGKLYSTSRRMPTDIGVSDALLTGVIRVRAGISLSLAKFTLCHNLQLTKDNPVIDKMNNLWKKKQSMKKL